MVVVERPAIERSAMRKVFLRVVVFVGVLYIFSLLDRFNVGYAALSMNKDLGLSPSQFGFGAGIFFVGYLMAELPSNLLLLRFGTRIWISRIMITWGIISACNAFVFDAHSFYALRFLLGIAEAGFLPGAMLYLATWVPAKDRSKAVLLFFSLGQLAGLTGPIISGWILSGDGMLGLRNWQTMFLLEALPTIILGIAVLWLLPNKPSDAPWLEAEERVWLEAELAKDQRYVSKHGLNGLAEGLRNPKVWALFAAKFANGLAVFTVALWLPQIARENTGLGVVEVGLIVAVPSLIVIPTMWLIGNYSDRTGNRALHTAMALGLCATCALGAALVPSPLASLVLIGCASICAVVATGISWAVAPSFLTGRAAAGGFAIINAGGITGGFVGGYLIGWLREETASFDAGLFLITAACTVGALSMLTLTRIPTPGTSPEPAR